ncbi:hypothetical protein TRFO_10537 [Tritrichomonas foetus]|uniref:DUF3447 domain-containing protein n=1 Tax=Tritrichomonas foetus TaxID=1144522 RepID=A0A1J4J892_9EUKA|nr:hypothetical protein TRFO_10537 [Tritrichomonas foetus]|eukprot:OHS95398.1 hypothetical protein TRFO_10537 [Tritrichomonas foetus]
MSLFPLNFSNNSEDKIYQMQEKYQETHDQLQQMILLHDKLKTIKENDVEELKEFLNEFFLADKISLRRALSTISTMINARPKYVYLYCQLLTHLSARTKFLFEKHEVSSLFNNKAALLVLLENGLITKDLIKEKFTVYPNELNFFYPEIEGTEKPKNIKMIENDELRVYGLNPDQIAESIRNDDLKAFQSATARLQTLNTLIRASRYETFDFVSNFGKRPSLIEYAAFFGSINVFKYLLEKGVEAGSTLPEFAAAGGNVEIIHLLEEDKTLPIGQECNLTAIEFFHRDLNEYFSNLNYENSPILNILVSIEHYNMRYFLNNILTEDLSKEDYELCLLYAVNSQNIDVLNLILTVPGIDVNRVFEHGVFLNMLI